MKKSLGCYNPRYWGRIKDSIFTDENQETYNRARLLWKNLDERHGTTITIDQILIAYVQAHKRIDFIVIGSTAIE